MKLLIKSLHFTALNTKHLLHHPTSEMTHAGKPMNTLWSLDGSTQDIWSHTWILTETVSRNSKYQDIYITPFQYPQDLLP